MMLRTRLQRPNEPGRRLWQSSTKHPNPWMRAVECEFPCTDNPAKQATPTAVHRLGLAADKACAMQEPQKLKSVSASWLSRHLLLMCCSISFG